VEFHDCASILHRAVRRAFVAAALPLGGRLFSPCVVIPNPLHSGA
jgi:hypothetical protein